jgi:hypothetical protein
MSESIRLNQELIPLLEKMQKEALPAITVEKTIGGRPEVFLLDPTTRKYSRLDPRFPPSLNRSVSNSEALLAVVVEEARRRKNATGNQMTVIFTEEGGTFSTDDTNRDNADGWDYERKHSKQLKALTSVLDKTLDHPGLLRAMSSLRTIVCGFQAIYAAMRKVRISKGMEIMSTPRVTDGESGVMVNVAFRIEGQAQGQAATFPGEFQVELPMVSLATRKYQIDIEVDSFTRDKELVFQLRAPALGAMMVQAILDEIDTFTAVAKAKLPDLLVVTDL